MPRGEYKPKKLGDGFASTTPSGTPVPPTPAQGNSGRSGAVCKDAVVNVADLVVNGRPRNGVINVADVLWMAPMKPVASEVSFTGCRLSNAVVEAATALGAFYQFISGRLEKVPGSQISVTFATTGLKYYTVDCKLYPGNMYFWGVWTDSLGVAEVDHFDFGLSILSGPALSYSTATGLTTLPTSVNLTDMTQDTSLSYSNVFTHIAPTYYSASMVPFM